MKTFGGFMVEGMTPLLSLAALLLRCFYKSKLVIAFPFKELNELILNKADNFLPIACFD